MLSKSISKSKRQVVGGRRLQMESLEKRELFAIDWINESTSGFAATYGANAALATEIVHRAISDWETYITDFNYDSDNNPATVDALNNTFSLTLSANSLGSGVRGVATASPDLTGRHFVGTVQIDNDGAGDGWFFDPTPYDDAEFTSITNSLGPASSFSASFVDVYSSGTADFYRTVLHEIGHVLGLYMSNTITSLSTPAGTDPLDGEALRQFTGVGYTTKFSGGHIYEGTHPNELMNKGRVTPGSSSPKVTTRQFVSDLDVKILRDAYGYAVVLPSTRDSANVTHDSLTGTLLVQGRVGGLNDVITIDTASGGSQIRVVVNGATEFILASEVSQIVIAGNGGTDTITTTDPTLVAMGIPINHAKYVVSSNQDRVDSGTLGDGIVDHDANFDGWQVSLRGAIQDANARNVGSVIYVPRGMYSLTISGSGGIAQGDLDITNNITIIGTGAGEAVINASGLWSTSSDRAFDVASGGSLGLYCMTVTGGMAPNLANEHGGAIYVRGGGSLYTGQCVIVGNRTTHSGANGGGIYFADSAGGTINTSVITGNVSSNYAGGVFLDAFVSSSTVTVSNTIIAKNSAVSGASDVLAEVGRTFTSGGKNRLGNSTIGFVHGTNNDHISTAVDYIVTGLSDTYNSGNDGYVLSLREAVKKSNDTAGTQEIWAPGWRYRLVRERGTALATDIDELRGDIDIKGSVILRGMPGVGSVAWKAGVTDAVFDFIGDFNGDGLGSGTDDGIVDGADFLIWQAAYGTGDLRADADDDGDVDGDDLDLWQDYFGSTFTRLGI